MPQSYVTERPLQDLLVDVCFDVDRLEEVKGDLDDALAKAGVQQDLIPLVMQRRGSYLSMAVAQERQVPDAEEIIDVMETWAADDPSFATQLLHEPRAIVQHAFQVRLPKEWNVTATNGNGVSLQITGDLEAKGIEVLDPVAETGADVNVDVDTDISSDTDTDTGTDTNTDTDTDTNTATDIDIDTDTVDVTETDTDIDTDIDTDTDVDVDVDLVAVDIDTDTDIDIDTDTDDVTDTDIDTDIDDVHVSPSITPTPAGQERYVVTAGERTKFEDYWEGRRSHWVVMDSRR